MAQVVLNVPDISCEHCVKTVTNALTPLQGVQNVQVDLPTKQVSVTYNPQQIDLDRMKSVLAEEDYPVATVQSSGTTATAQQPATAIDPVCGMSVDTATARYTSDYQGQTYYFCAPGCKRAFDANPQNYLGTAKA